MNGDGENNYENNYDNPITIDNNVLVIPPLGFNNTGAICYFNSLLQCLLSSKNFLRFILFEKPIPIFTEFFKNIINDKWDTVFTTRVLQNYNIMASNQSSSEYFIFLVDFLKLEDIFECQYKLVSECKGCGFKKELKDITYNILVDNDFSEFFNYREELHGVLCDNCKAKCNMDRRRIIHSLPAIIAISFNKYFGKKEVSYPTRFKISDIEYKLIGSIEHYGVLGAGHYISRFHRNDENYLGDDSRVYGIPSISPTNDTYMVFYERIK